MKLQLLLTAVICFLTSLVTADQTFTIPTAAQAAQYTIPTTINGAQVKPAPPPPIALPQTPTTPNKSLPPPQYTAIAIDVNSFKAVAATASARSSVYSVLDANHLNPTTLDASSKSWYTALPTQVWPYFSDYYAAIQSIIDQDVKDGKAVSPATTGSVSAVPLPTALVIPSGMGVGLEVRVMAAMVAAAMVAVAVL